MENNQNIATVRLNVLVDKTKLERFKKIAKKKNSSASQQIRIFIDKYLSENSAEFSLC